MTLKELTRDEQLVLLALVRLMIQQDGQFSAEEAAELQTITDELGEEDFWSLAQQAAEKMQDEAAIRHHAERVTRPAAHALIYGTLFDLAAQGSIVSDEGALLEWLQSVWQLEAATAAD